MSNDDHTLSSWSDSIEETLIALFLGLMTLITFANVIARMRDSNILWALESTVFLFAFLVLMGASYGVKKNFHIGVDVLVRLFPASVQRKIALFAAVVCIVFAALLLKGSWDYWYAFVSKRAFYEVNDIPMPEFLQFFADWLNDGERYEKLPRFIPYTILPISMSLLLFRFIQAFFRVWRGEQLLLVETHDVDDDLDAANVLGASNGLDENIDEPGAANSHDANSKEAR